MCNRLSQWRRSTDFCKILSKKHFMISISGELGKLFPLLYQGIGQTIPLLYQGNWANYFPCSARELGKLFPCSTRGIGQTISFLYKGIRRTISPALPGELCKLFPLLYQGNWSNYFPCIVSTYFSNSPVFAPCGFCHLLVSSPGY